MKNLLKPSFALFQSVTICKIMWFRLHIVNKGGFFAYALTIEGGKWEKIPTTLILKKATYKRWKELKTEKNYCDRYFLGKCLVGGKELLMKINSSIEEHNKRYHGDFTIVS